MTKHLIPAKTINFLLKVSKIHQSFFECKLSIISTPLSIPRVTTPPGRWQFPSIWGATQNLVGLHPEGTQSTRNPFAVFALLLNCRKIWVLCVIVITAVAPRTRVVIVSLLARPEVSNWTGVAACRYKFSFLNYADHCQPRGFVQTLIP